VQARRQEVQAGKIVVEKTKAGMPYYYYYYFKKKNNGAFAFSVL